MRGNEEIVVMFIVLENFSLNGSGMSHALLGESRDDGGVEEGEILPLVLLHGIVDL